MGMVDGPNLYAYVGGQPARYVDRMGLFIPQTWPPDSPEFQGCQAYAIAEQATGATTSIRHCVYVCELKRCHGTIGGWVGTWINLMVEYWWPSEDDWWDDINAGNDGALINVSKCDDEDKCTNECRGMGW
jgi:hypothetical protein